MVPWGSCHNQPLFPAEMNNVMVIGTDFQSAKFDLVPILLVVVLFQESLSGITFLESLSWNHFLETTFSESLALAMSQPLTDSEQNS
jgi:hypothetical protein